MEGVRRSRWVRAGGDVFVVCTALAAAVSARAGAALSYDGSYYLYNILQWRRAFTPYDRYGARAVQLPVLALAQVTDDLRWLRLAFCAGYAAVPVIVALVCWLLLRRRAPDLMVWVALGLGVVALPGALFQVSESMIVALVAWPLLIAVLLDLEAAAAVVGAGAAAFAFYESALSAAAFALVGLVALARAVRNDGNRMRLLVFGAGLLALIPLRYRALPIDYAGPAHRVSIEVLRTVFQSRRRGARSSPWSPPGWSAPPSWRAGGGPGSPAHRAGGSSWPDCRSPASPWPVWSCSPGRCRPAAGRACWTTVTSPSSSSARSCSWQPSTRGRDLDRIAGCGPC